MTRLFSTLSCLLLLLPSVAFAHTGAAGDAISFMHGFSHPMGGVDHLLAMIAVGIWAAQIGGRAVWLVPTAFVVVMILGGVVGFSGINMPFIEQGILVSVLIMGVLIAGAFKLPLQFSTAIVAVFAVFHGFAHGAEMPATIGAGVYVLGFAIATALLHVSGVLSGAIFKSINMQLVNRLTGGAIALGGVYLAVA